jgi:hypothetical protein
MHHWYPGHPNWARSDWLNFKEECAMLMQGQLSHSESDRPLNMLAGKIRRPSSSKETTSLSHKESRTAHHAREVCRCMIEQTVVEPQIEFISKYLYN